MAILTHGDDPPDYGRDTLITYALNSLGRIVEFDSNPSKPFSIIQVTTSDPIFSKQLADVVLEELESLNRYFKNQAVNDKISFINERIAFVEKDLKSSEIALKTFNEKIDKYLLHH